ncbi:MAG: cell envelope biogenesis protein OmpA [Bacteroidota bacterium]
MKSSRKGSDEELQLIQLREILLKKDRTAIREIQELIDDPEQLSPKVQPIIEEQLELLKANFPAQYEKVVNNLIEQKLKDSQEEILNVIYPVLGKMIKKFITHQFQMIKDSIDRQVRKTFSTKGFWTRVKSRFFGVDHSEIILSDADKPVIEEIYAIQRNSGLLMGIASMQETIDQDVIAGMLTAIKSFVEDAFKKEQQDLEMIEYGNYKIFIQNFPTFYIAVAMSGSMSTGEKGDLSDKIMDFAEDVLSSRQELNGDNYEYISTELKTRFINPQIVST